MGESDITAVLCRSVVKYWDANEITFLFCFRKGGTVFSQTKLEPVFIDRQHVFSDITE